MKYYKILQNNHFIGAASSNDFIRFQPFINGFLRSNENYGEYVSCNGLLYRCGWMWPISNQNIAYEDAQLIEIQEDEYKAYMAAIAANEDIEDESNTWVEPPEPAPNPVDVESLAFIKQSKIKEMSNACRSTIERGFDLQLNDSKIHHFSLSAQDQLNLMALAAAAETEQLIPYHADGEQSMFFTAAEIKQIIATANAFKTYHTVYFNSLKSYINSLNTIEEVSTITYGVPIPAEYQTEVLKVLLK